MNRKILLAILGAAFVGIVTGCFLHVQREWKVQDRDACTKQLFAMNTYMSFTAYGENAAQAVDAAMAQVQALDELLSVGKKSSEVSALNREGSLEVSEDTAELFYRALEIYEETAGIFDVTICPVMELWGFPSKNYHVASEEELAQVLPFVDASRVKIVPKEQGGAAVTLGTGQKVDFGGIAKGYAAMKVMEIFRSYGITSGQVSLGGNVQVLGAKPDGSRWRIGIRDPEGGQKDPIAVVPVDNRAVVTSGGYERYFEEDGKRYIHILDPRTGRPAEGDLLSVTVLSEDGTLADALSTSLYIMGKEEACAYWRAHREDFDMVLVTEDQELCVTDGIADGFQSEQTYQVLK